MALTKVNRGGLNTGISDSSDATFLTVDSSEQAVIKGENSATTSLQQGLAKAWIDAPDGLASINDSFNISTLDDDGTGDGGLNYTSNMSSTSYAILCACDDDTRTTTMLTNQPTNGTQATTGVDFATHRTSSTVALTDTDVRSYISINGDLA
jgi:hypothetical protein